jgi:manganese/iron transport system ATP-binding protein/manganese/zinc/iron transport system ATP- binding protein
MGRYSKTPWYRDLSPTDRELADDALEMVRMSEFKNRQIGQLSGGQQQRVFMARAIAQGGDLLLLDEPFSGVDAATERAILDVLRKSRESGKTTLVVHHDLSTAAEYFDQLILLKQRLFGFGPPEAILQPELLSEVYEGTLRVFANLSSKKEPSPANKDRLPGDSNG